MLAVSALVALTLTPATSTDAFVKHMMEARETVARLAFDPDRYFADERSGRNDIRIVYSGDAFGWPIYAIAIRRGCGPANTGRGCDAGFRMRMARAPAPASMSRPRDRAIPIWRRFTEGPGRTPRQAAAILDEAEVEWLETDSVDCPGVAPLLERTSAMSWVPVGLSPGQMPAAPVMHYDVVEISFSAYSSRATYIGAIVEGAPSGWAARLALAAERCWRPAASVAPWRTK